MYNILFWVNVSIKILESINIDIFVSLLIKFSCMWIEMQEIVYSRIEGNA